MGCENSKHDDTVTGRTGRDTQYGAQSAEGCETHDHPLTKEAFVSQKECGEQDSLTATTDNNGSSVGQQTSKSGGVRDTQSNASACCMDDDPEVTVFMTPNNSPNSLQSFDMMSPTASQTGEKRRSFNPTSARLADRGNDMLSPTSSFRSTSGLSLFSGPQASRGMLSPTDSSFNGPLGVETPTHEAINTPLKPFSVAQWAIDAPHQKTPTSTHSGLRVSDNNVGDTDQEQTETRFNRQVVRKQSFSTNGDEPSNFVRSVEEAFRSTKNRAIAALCHETDHEELARVALKAENPKTIKSVTQWGKTVQDPVPRQLRASTVNELRTLTETPESIHYARSMSSLLVSAHQQMMAHQCQLLNLQGDDERNSSQGERNSNASRLSGTQQQQIRTPKGGGGLPRNRSPDPPRQGQEHESVFLPPALLSPSNTELSQVATSRDALPPTPPPVAITSPASVFGDAEDHPHRVCDPKSLESRELFISSQEEGLTAEVPEHF